MKSIWHRVVEQLNRHQERMRNEMVSRLVSPDIGTRQQALDEAWATGGMAWLEAVEEAIRHLVGRSDIHFYEPDGMRTGDSEKAYRELLRLARQGQLGRDPAFAQWLMADVNGQSGSLQEELASMGGMVLTLYRLLDVEMALRTRPRK